MVYKNIITTITTTSTYINIYCASLHVMKVERDLVGEMVGEEE